MDVLILQAKSLVRIFYAPFLNLEKQQLLHHNNHHHHQQQQLSDFNNIHIYLFIFRTIVALFSQT